MRRILRAARFFAAIALAVSITRAPAASAEHAWIQPSTFVAPYGARLAHALPRPQLEIAFGIFLLLISARFLVSLVW